MKTLNSGFVNAIPLLPMTSWIGVQTCTSPHFLCRNFASSTCMELDGSGGMHPSDGTFPSCMLCKSWHYLCPFCSCHFSFLFPCSFLCLSRRICARMTLKNCRNWIDSLVIDFLNFCWSSMCLWMRNHLFCLCPCPCLLSSFCILSCLGDDRKGTLLFSGNFLCSPMPCKFCLNCLVA